jgi:hypothetical protein
VSSPREEANDMMTIGIRAAVVYALLAAAPVAATEPGADGALREEYVRSVNEAGTYTSDAIDTETRGIVRSVHGSTVVLETNAGATFLVNVSAIRADVRDRLRAGVPIAVRGPVVGIQIAARSIDAPGGRNGDTGTGRAAASATDRDRARRTVTGTIVSIDWPAVVVRTDDGARIPVNADALPASAASSLIVDESITIVGVMAGDTLVARAVEPARRD